MNVLFSNSFILYRHSAAEDSRGDQGPDIQTLGFFNFDTDTATLSSSSSPSFYTSYINDDEDIIIHGVLKNLFSHLELELSYVMKGSLLIFA